MVNEAMPQHEEEQAKVLEQFDEAVKSLGERVVNQASLDEVKHWLSEAEMLVEKIEDQAERIKGVQTLEIWKEQINEKYPEGEEN